MTQTNDTLTQLVAARLRIDELEKLLSKMSWYANHPGSTGIDDIDERRDREWEEFNRALGHKEIPTTTADEVIALAQWCLNHSQALREFNEINPMTALDSYKKALLKLQTLFEDQQDIERTLPPETRALLEKWEG